MAGPLRSPGSLAAALLAAMWLMGCPTDDDTPTPIDVPCTPSQPAPYPDGLPYLGIHATPRGDDSVAWHGDRHRHVVTNPVIAILSVGAPRPLRLRPRGGGSSLSWSLGNGDLFVMGGACQHDWEHTVPKVRVTTGPRMSITFRSL